LIFFLYEMFMVISIKFLCVFLGKNLITSAISVESINIAFTKYEIKKFIGLNDFEWYRMKM